MKKSIIIVAGLLIGLTSAFAQELKTNSTSLKKERKAKAQQKKNEKIMKMDEIVSFSADQKTKIQEIQTQSNEKVKSIRMKYKKAEDKTTMKEELKQAQEERRKSIRAVLTKEQKKKWKEYKKANKVTDNSTKG